VLRELHIRNLGVIGEAHVDFAPGLNVVTGETGVGKTLLVTSLALVCGSRAAARLVATGAEEASADAVVDLGSHVPAELQELGVDPGEDLILTRRVSADGKSRAWIGGRLVPVSVLSEVGCQLVEVHGQGAGFALANPATQLRAVDTLAGNEDPLEAYVDALRSLRALEAERAQLLQDEAARERESELLAFQADEIERAELQPVQDEHIADELSRLEHAERLSEVGAQVVELAGGDGGAGRLSEAHRALEAASGIDPSLRPLVERLAEAAMLADEAARDVRAWAESLEGNEARLDALRERKALIASLRRKYGGTVEEIVATGAAARARLDQLEGASERLQSVDAEAAGVKVEAEAFAAKLSERRRKAASKLTKMVLAELPALALPNAVFEAECSASPEWTEHGRDKIAFRFSESSSREPDLIGKVASGGELSRAMIAVTLALARAHSVPVLVFDEADQGIGGEAALELARRLQRLGRTHQVLVVSHLPQIAAFADRHIAVRRTASGVEVDVVTEQDRIAEISRMLAGLESSDLARAHAAELIELADTEREIKNPAGGRRVG
jgi:DNA repair protein RecN (Recombination protein N)